jgi:2-methylisocitrate lyase-like PEP mutase family enzyme
MNDSVAAKLRGILANGEVVVAPGAHDPLTGRLVQRLGFSACYVGGWMTGAHLATTEPLTTLTEQAEVAGKVARAVDIPVICDADAGFGDPIQVIHTVRVFEDAGVSAIHIEDQVYPKRASYHRGLEHVVPLEEFLTKIRYALEARRNPDFIIIGRTDAGTAVNGSWEEAVRRVKALEDVGVDAIMPMARTLEEMRTFQMLYPSPRLPLLTTAYFNGPSVEDIRALGFQVIIYPLATMVASMSAVLALYQGLKDEGICRFDTERALEVREEIKMAIGLYDYYKIEDMTTERDRHPQVGGPPALDEG